MVVELRPNCELAKAIDRVESAASALANDSLSPREETAAEVERTEARVHLLEVIQKTLVVIQDRMVSTIMSAIREQVIQDPSDMELEANEAMGVISDEN